MNFTNPQIKLPEFNKEVLIKYKDYEENIRYYITELDFCNGDLVFTESSGERYMYWHIHEIIGWMYASELDSIE